MIKFRCNKLGRDKGLEGFKAEGITPRHKFLSGQELCHELKHKLIEESQEVNEAQNISDVTVELADVLEVIDGLCKAYGIDKKELMRVKKEKREERGGFETGYYVEYVEMPEDNTRVKHFRASPDKYPEE